MSELTGVESRCQASAAGHTAIPTGSSANTESGPGAQAAAGLAQPEDIPARTHLSLWAMPSSSIPFNLAGLWVHTAVCCMRLWVYLSSLWASPVAMATPGVQEALVMVARVHEG